MERKEGRICQSCGMLMTTPEAFGTEAQGSKSVDYCRFCFQDGNFVDPDIDVEQMINKVAHFIPEAQAKEPPHTFIPRLKRWQKKPELQAKPPLIISPAR